MTRAAEERERREWERSRLLCGCMLAPWAKEGFDIRAALPFPWDREGAAPAGRELSEAEAWAEFERAKAERGLT